jgi:hypothetical protein
VRRPTGRRASPFFRIVSADVRWRPSSLQRWKARQFGRQSVAVLSSAPGKLALRSAEYFSNAVGFLAFGEIVGLDRSVGEEMAGSSGERRLNGRLKIELVESGLGRPAGAVGIRSPYENPPVRGAISEQRPLAAFDGTPVDPKFFDAGRGPGELIAIFLRVFFWKAGVTSKRSLLVRVSLQLLLSRGIRGTWFGPKMEASSGRESEASREE